MRNPFRLAMDPNTVDKVKFHIGDVGASVWEEISVGGTDYAKANYGWPVMEGPCSIGSNVACDARSDFHDPIYYYEHRKLTEGGAVTGSVFVPAGLWPSDYEFLFVDFIFGEIYNLVKDASRECRDCVPPIPGYRNETFHEHKDMVDVFFGPYQDTQALYIVSRSDGQNIRRIRYTGTSNRSPMANFTVDDTSAMIGEVLSFDATSSSDPDGDGLTYSWDFGDGSTSAQESPQHAFEENGTYKVSLTVTDVIGLSNEMFMFISVGTPPTAKIVSPAVGTNFSVGERLLLSGVAKDSLGNALNSSQIFWEVRQHHASHFHPFLDKSAGNDIELFAAPEPEDFLAATSSFLRVIMYAVDSFGVMTETYRDVFPNLVMVDIDSYPQKLHVLVDEFPVETPETITSWENHNLRINVEDQYPFAFVSWSDGGERSHKMTIPAASSTNPYISATFELNSTADGSLELNGQVKNCSAAQGCGRCEGHCENNDECIGMLVCYQKGGRNRYVPGCLGLDTSNTDWCTFDPSTNFTFTALTTAPTPAPTVEPISTPAPIPGMAPVGIPVPSDMDDPTLEPTFKPSETSVDPEEDQTSKPSSTIRGTPSSPVASGYDSFQYSMAASILLSWVLTAAMIVNC